MSENEDDSVDSNGNIRDLIADSDEPKHRRYVIRTDYRKSKRPRQTSSTDETYSTEDTPVTEESEPDPKPKPHRGGGIFLSLGGFPGNNEMIPKKYNIKKESQKVQRFFSAKIKKNSLNFTGT